MSGEQLRAATAKAVGTPHAAVVATQAADTAEAEAATACTAAGCEKGARGGGLDDRSLVQGPLSPFSPFRVAGGHVQGLRVTALALGLALGTAGASLFQFALGGGSSRRLFADFFVLVLLCLSLLRVSPLHPPVLEPHLHLHATSKEMRDK